MIGVAAVRNFARACALRDAAPCRGSVGGVLREGDSLPLLCLVLRGRQSCVS